MTRRKVVVPKPVVKDEPKSGKGTIANRARHLLPYVANISKCNALDLQIYILQHLLHLSASPCSSVPNHPSVVLGWFYPADEIPKMTMRLDMYAEELSRAASPNYKPQIIE